MINDSVLFRDLKKKNRTIFMFIAVIIADITVIFFIKMTLIVNC
jgi:hypothetical protein